MRLLLICWLAPSGWPRCRHPRRPVYGGGRVHRYSPEGELLEALPVPAAQSTCCAFGGPGLDRLYVTTATEGWSEERRRTESTAGLVYRLDTDARGVPAAPFRPNPGWGAAEG